MKEKMIVQEALKRTWASDNDPGSSTCNPIADSSLTSQLIYDIFGGEILKTHWKKGWHFYNRIDGERIDFTKLETEKSPVNKRFEDLPSTPEETCNYFEQEDYSTFLMKFIGAFEETVGMELKRTGYSA